MPSDAEVRASIARAVNLSGLDTIQFPDNPQATRAIQQLVAAITTRLGARSPFLERVPTWGDLIRFGIAGLRTPSGDVITPRLPPTAGSDPVPFNVLQESEGSWTPVDASGAGLSLTVGSARWIRVNRLVTAWLDITYPSTANGSAARIGGLPFAAFGFHPLGIAFTGVSTLARGETQGSELRLYQAGGSTVSNATMSGAVLRAQVTYVTG